MTLKEALAIILASCVNMALAGYTSWHSGYEAALTDSCHTTCIESGYDDSSLEDDGCVCIQYSVMEGN